MRPVGVAVLLLLCFVLLLGVFGFYWRLLQNPGGGGSIASFPAVGDVLFAVV